MIKSLQNSASVALLGLAAAVAAAPALAQQTAQPVAFEAEDAGANQVNFSGKLRMLSQRIPAHACQAYEGFDTEHALEVLNGATAEFDRIIHALEFGDVDMGLPLAENRRLTLAAIDEVKAAWAPMHELADATAAGTVTGEQIDQAREQSTALLKAAQALVVEKVAQYSNPADMAQAESFLIDIAGRQRSLIQMISKDACLAMTGHTGAEGLEELESTMATFEATLGALQTGMESVGIRKPPTPQIAAALAEIAGEWKLIRPTLAKVMAQDIVAHEEGEAMFKELNVMLANMNTVVGMYAAAVQ